jgi:hypothetical protein
MALVLWAAAAAAQPAPAVTAVDEAALQALVARGEQLAIDKDYAGAIAVWKEADRLAARALHACLIGRAYTRRGLWPQAELFFAACRARATADHPAPGWLDTAERELAAQIERAGAAAITIVVEPAVDGAQVKLSGFAPDEAVPAGTLHLSPGRHTVSVSAPGHDPASETFDVDGPAARTITIALGGGPLPPPVLPAPPGRVRRSKLPWIVIGAGGALALGGGVYHATVLRGAWNDLEATTDRDFYDGEGDRAWRSARRNTVILYGAAAATIGVGVALHALNVGDRREAPQVGLVPVDGGGVVSVGWER